MSLTNRNILVIVSWDLVISLIRISNLFRISCFVLRIYACPLFTFPLATDAKIPPKHSAAKTVNPTLELVRKES